MTPASGGTRCAASLLDLAAMISPAMPLSTAGAVLGVAEVVFVVVPVAFVAVWLWLQIWQGLTGNTFGKALLGLRLVRAADHRPPGVGATVLRGLAFVATVGLAGLPVLLSSRPRAAWHDRISGLTVLDVTTGANPLGQRQQRTLRRAPDRGLNRVVSPVPVSGRRG
ncbi:RDD family protein [Mycobacterium sp. GA-2829]|uniref:RDD family protein n=1 Tax=Mycobacterium sp. GA-2829 TaxID=1772283 RepID=UPI001E2FB9C1|nr:RDD family protein [Mycobacterium sp. GA-2829]